MDADNLIRKIEFTLIDEGQRDFKKFKLGEFIKYTPSEVASILQKHKEIFQQPDFWEYGGFVMGDMMTFPDTVEEFMEQYKIVDTEKIYSNGIELVPIFRMKQWFEHEKVQAEALHDLIEGRFNIQAKPLVRCMNCKYCEVAKNGINAWCNKHEFCVDVCDYCSFAERNRDGQTT